MEIPEEGGEGEYLRMTTASGRGEAEEGGWNQGCPGQLKVQGGGAMKGCDVGQRLKEEGVEAQ